MQRCVTLVVMALLLAVTAAGGEVADGVIVQPAWLRLDLEPEAFALTTFTVSSPSPFAVLAVDGDCRCITPLMSLPATADATGTVRLQVRIAGAVPGIKHLVFRTTRGAVSAGIQVVGRGLGEGLDILRSELALAGRNHWQMWLLAHDLRGALRNCGCSSGSLGGIDLLAGLPAACAATAPSVAVRFLLSGNSDGSHPGVSAALGLRGWRRDDAAIIASADPGSALGVDGPVAIIPTISTSLANARLVRPPLDGGMVVMVLQVDAERRIQRQVAMPIDRSLPRDEGILAGFPQPATRALADHASDPSACAGCHLSAMTAWLASAHAHALSRLPPESRDDECVSCHSTAQPGADARAPAVTCEACHAAGAAHAASPGAVHTVAVDCRTCHDSRHHPAFQREREWPIIAHGGR
jgi:hypothetical protein